MWWKSKSRRSGCCATVWWRKHEEERKAVSIMAWPAAHSRSPLIHNYWIKQHNLNAEYRREPVPPDKFVEFVTHLREHGYVGGNVTVPHKQAVLALSEPDERARAV